MKRKNKMLAAALVTALLLCLLPATALATATPSPAPTAAATPQATAEATPEPAAETPEATAALLPDGTEAAYNEADQTLYAAAGSVTYNNGGTVYNNGGTVYNNAGLVYNNGGLVYNNAGTVYSNGGTVYNNAGQVFNNGAIVYTNAGDTADSVISGYYRVSLGGDYSAFADITGLDAEPGAGGYLIAKDAVFDVADVGLDANVVVLTPAQFAKVAAYFVKADMTANGITDALISGAIPNVLGKTWTTSKHVPFTDPLLLDASALGGIGLEDLGSPGYTRVSGTLGIESKVQRLVGADDRDGYRLRVRRVGVAAVVEPRAGLRITGTGL